MAKYWYHVTTHNRLEGIAKSGLSRGASRAIGSPAYDSNAARGVFLSDAKGMPYWHSKAKDHAEHRSDSPLDEGEVPVVLRVSPRPVKQADRDELGERDSRSAAVISKSRILPGAIDIYDGKRWRPVREWDQVDPEIGGSRQQDEQDGEPFEWQHLKSYDSPLRPSEGLDDDAKIRSSRGAQAHRRFAARRPVSIGPRGGRYIVTPSGNKFYIARVGGRLVVKKA